MRYYEYAPDQWKIAPKPFLKTHQKASQLNLWLWELPPLVLLETLADTQNSAV